MCTPPSEQTGPSLGCEAIAGPVKGPTEQTGPGFSLEFLLYICVGQGLLVFQHLKFMFILTIVHIWSV